MWAWLSGGTPAHEVVLYTRQGCHLCDDAWELLQQAAKRHRLTLSTRDVDADPALAAAYGECVPVVQIDGTVRFRGVVNAVLLERMLRQPKEKS